MRRAGFDSWCWLGDGSSVGVLHQVVTLEFAGSNPVRHTTSAWNPRTSGGWYTIRRYSGATRDCREDARARGMSQSVRRGLAKAEERVRFPYPAPFARHWLCGDL